MVENLLQKTTNVRGETPKIEWFFKRLAISLFEEKSIYL